MNITIDSNTGGLAFWSSVEDTSRATVMAAAEAAGIKRFIPERPPVSTALRTAMEDYAKDVFGRRRHEPIQILQTAQARTFECVRCIRGETQNEHRFLFSASVNDQGHVFEVSTNDGYYVTDGSNSVHQVDVVRHLQSRVDTQLTILPGVIVTQSLAKALRSWNCQCLNDRGGLWFLPSSRVAAYRAWAEVFTKNTRCQFVLAEVEVSHNPDFIDHLIGEVRGEVIAGLAEITQDMLNATGGMMDRSIRLRMDKAEEFLRKIEQYEAITSVTMNDMRDAVQKTKQALALQKLVASAV